jgi:hypothetical protein
MPIYLAHGFRWPRDGFTGIRVHAIVNKLDEVSVEYIQNENSRNSILSSLRTNFPSLLKPLENGGRRLDFLEQYDPADISSAAISQPYAFVCDSVVMIAGGQDGWAEHYNSQLLQTQAQEQAITRAEKIGSPRVRQKTQPMSIAAPFNSPANITALSLNIEDVMADSPPLSTEAWEALADLRDKLAEGEKIGWWVIYNGDPDRDYPSSEDEEGAKTPTDVGTASGENASNPGSATEEKQKSQHSSTSATSAQSGTFTASDIKTHPQGQTQDQGQRMRSPTGGRIPPPIPPSHTPRSPVPKASTLPFRPPPLPQTESTTGKGLTKPDTGKELPKSPGVRKFWKKSTS